MSVKIRLRRMGAKKAPFYRIIIANFFDETAISGVTAVCNNNSVEGSLLHTHSSQSDLYHFFVLQNINKNVFYIHYACSVNSDVY